ncbi:MAG: glycoside hydrolase family 3 C-terminal domain-containing protein, partial [Clostridiales bacterium]|nr:glycoside hydrolase family 3 C-terminal domain-containing protein [Clostridiales bacterium]
MKRIILATTDPAPSDREKRNALLARTIGADGIVLLENDGVLPLKTNRVALYGLGARHTAFGGTGSGENRPRYRVTIEEGLNNAGFEILTKDWLDGLDREYDFAKKAWRKQLTKGLKKCKKTAQMDYASAHPFLPPLGGKIEKADTDTALYVLTRQAGEGFDRQLTKGDYYIREEELGQLKTLCALYPKTVLVLNAGGVIDLSFTKELSLSAILLVSLGGMEAGNAAADVLSGKVSPSGRLAATWAERYED